MSFRDRDHAARELALALAELRGRRPLVLGIPRGAVPMARTIARELGGELDVVLVHKIGAPAQPEFAIGAVDESGGVHLEPWAKSLARSREWLDEAVATELARARERRARYTPTRPPIEPRGRVVVVVDDGIATGATMDAALRLLRAREPERLIAAAAVASEEAVERLERIADDVVCLEVPREFHAVSLWFDEFRQVDDAEVVALLREAEHEAGAAPAGPLS